MAPTPLTERMRAASLSDSPPLPPPPLPVKPFPRHVQSSAWPASRGSLDVDRPADFPGARRTAGSFSGYPASGESSGTATRNNSITSAHSAATVLPHYAPAPATATIPPYDGERRHQQQQQQGLTPVEGQSVFKVPPLPRVAASALASSAAGPHLGGGNNSHYPQPTRASVSAYDTKAIFNSFDTLPPLPALPTSQNPHPAPDPSGAGAQFPHPSHPTSALSSLFLHVLPCFNGNPLRNPIESLNTLVTSHITATFARYSSPARVLATLTADLRDILGSGMLTLEAKLHAVDDADKLVGRLVEVWVFFWTTVVPYVEGIFLPLTLDSRIIEAVAVERAAAPGREDSNSTSAHAIDPRLHLLTLFLVSLLHPHLPRVLPLLAPPHPLLSPAHLARLQQMSLVLLTQSDPDVIGELESTASHYSRATSRDGRNIREGLEDLLRSVGAATRARAQGSADPLLSNGGPIGLGSTPAKKAADNHRRGGWIAGKHRRNYSQAAAEIPSATQEDLNPVSPSRGLQSSGSSAFSNGGGGTATNDASHLRSAGATPRQQPNVFRSQVPSTFGGASFATATPTYTFAGGGLRSHAAAADDQSRIGADDDTESEAGYLDSLRSPEIPWSATSSPTQADSDGERAYAGLSRRSTDSRPAPVGLGPELVFTGGYDSSGGDDRVAPGEERRHSSPPTLSVSPGSAA